MAAGGAARRAAAASHAVPRPAPTALCALDGGLALLIGLGLALIYRATRQRWLWNDGFGLGPQLEWDPGSSWPHPLYLPVVRALAALPGEAWPYGPLWAASWLPGALSIAALFLWLRRTVERSVALCWSLLFAFSPLVWFFATTIEVHALHAAVVGLGALLVWQLPWARPALALPLAALAFLALAASHLTAALLLPGWWALCRCCAADPRGRIGPEISDPSASDPAPPDGLEALGPPTPGKETRDPRGVPMRSSPLSAVQLWLVLPLLLLLAWLASLAGSAAGHWGGGLAGAIDQILDQIRRDARGPSWGWIEADLLVPLGYLPWLPIALGALALSRRGPASRGLATLLWIAPLLGFTALWAVPNAGGYLLGLLLPLGELAARGGAALFRSARGRLLLPLALLPWVAWSGWRDNQAWRALERAEARAQRAAAVAAQGSAAGLLLSFDPRRQPIGLDVPGVREFNAALRCEAALAAGRDPAELARELCDDLERLWPGFAARILVDARFLRRPDLDPLLSALAIAFEAELERRFVVEPAAAGPWPLLRLADLGPR